MERASFPIVVPQTALETINGFSVVFIANEHGFEPVFVNMGKDDYQNVEILSGLNTGQQYIMNGGFILKAQLAKSTFGDGHNH